MNAGAATSELALTWLRRLRNRPAWSRSRRRTSLRPSDLRLVRIDLDMRAMDTPGAGITLTDASGEKVRMPAAGGFGVSFNSAVTFLELDASDTLFRSELSSAPFGRLLTALGAGAGSCWFWGMSALF